MRQNLNIIKNGPLAITMALPQLFLVKYESHSLKKLKNRRKNKNGNVIKNV